MQKIGNQRKVGSYWIKLHTGWVTAHFNGECFWYGNGPLSSKNIHEIKEQRIPSPEDEKGIYFPDKIHSDTEQLLKNTFDIIREKIIKNQKKYGWSNEWLLDDWENDCRQHMMEHIQKGDPKDIIIYSMFMLFHGWSTATPPLSEVKDSGSISQIFDNNFDCYADQHEMDVLLPVIPAMTKEKFIEVVSTLLQSTTAEAVEVVRKHWENLDCDDNVPSEVSDMINDITRDIQQLNTNI